MLGLLTWFLAGAAAIAGARMIPAGRSSVWLESVCSIGAAVAGGMTATALDFGGWTEPDPRAFAFSFAVAAAALGLVRTLRLSRRRR